MTTYKCTKGFTLNHEQMADNTIVRNECKVEPDSVWLWKKEQGETITVINKRLIEITLRRVDFVNHFERVSA